MMPRHRRVVIPDCPHHITQRGNNRRAIFFGDADRGGNSGRNSGTVTITPKCE
jgi:REP element-mobilizing transposase RayT